ncbi:hypothetical protein VPH35_069770 [Triticum aestivum]
MLSSSSLWILQFFLVRTSESLFDYTFPRVTNHTCLSTFNIFSLPNISYVARPVLPIMSLQLLFWLSRNGIAAMISILLVEAGTYILISCFVQTCFLCLPEC